MKTLDLTGLRFVPADRALYCGDDVDGIRCNRNLAFLGDSEVFTVEYLEPLGLNLIALRGGRANKYCIDDTSRMICESDAPGDYGKFQVEIVQGATG